MSLQIALIAVCMWMFGANSQSPNGGGPSLASVFNRSPPQDLLSGLANSQTCPYSTTISCTGKTTYRTIDGSCNHGSHPYVGKSDTPYIRRMPALYSHTDKNKPRTQTFFGKPLPAPRNITLLYFRNVDAKNVEIDDPPSTTFSNAAAVFARFVEHDLYDTRLVDVTGNCCPTSSSTTGKCSNIELGANDIFFKQYGKTCLPKASVMDSRPLDCKDGGVVQQINLNTHYLDLSNIYGSTKTKSDQLRTKINGLLNVTVNVDEILMPKTAFKKCNTASTDKTCFLAGDSRANNDPMLMAMYTIWVRFHNDIAKQIKGINPKFDDEQIYQVSRKIVIGSYQHIVYNEFFPSINPKTALKPPTGNTAANADSKPQIANYFHIAYTGLADTMTLGKFKIGATDVPLKSHWYNPDEIWKTGGVKNIAEGMMAGASGKIDRFMAKALYDEYLQKIVGDGTDKVSLNLQQSREDGITTYFVMASVQQNKYTMAAYADISTIGTTTKTLLENKLYKYIYDIEFLPGVLGEDVVTGDATGPLMKNILEEQFKNLRDGDMFFYQHKNIFTDDKLTEIKKSSMATIMCKYAKTLKAPGKVFNIIDTSGNTNDDCSAHITAAKVLDICKWGTVGWTEWFFSECQGGIRFKTRYCQYDAESTCKCDGKPIAVESCAPNLQLLISRELKEEVEFEYSLYFDDQGRPRPGVHETSQEVVSNILNHVVHY